MYRLTIAGGGPGSEAFVLPEARAAIDTAGYVFADKRYAHFVKHDRVEIFGKVMETVERIGEKLQCCDVTVIVSGDPLFFSLTKTIRRALPDVELKIIPGIGSLQYLAARCNKTTENAAFISAHGRELNADELICDVKNHNGVYLLCDKKNHPGYIAGLLVSGGLGDAQMYVGSRLSYEDEVIIEGSAFNLSDRQYDDLCVAAIFYEATSSQRPTASLELEKSAYVLQKSSESEKSASERPSSDLENAASELSFCSDSEKKAAEAATPGGSAAFSSSDTVDTYKIPAALLNDEAFIRSKVPMTREEVRWAILGKLRLQPGDILWDIGAGTGSVTMECGRMLTLLGPASGNGSRLGQVYAVERNADAIELIEKNKARFGLENIHIIKGDAIECVKSFPKPDCVFIGGSGRELKDLLGFIKGLGSHIRVITACVTMETIAQALEAYDHTWANVDMIQINIGRGKALGSYHVMDGSHPVTLFCGKTQ